MKTDSFLARIVAWVFLCHVAGCVGIACPAGYADEKIVRELFVPETELGALFEGAMDRVLIPRDDFEAIVQRARRIELATDRKRPDRPFEAVLLSSEYAIDVADGRAVIDGMLTLDLLTEGPVAVPLPLRGVAVLEATLEDTGRAIPFGSLQGGSEKQFVLKDEKMHRIRLRMTAPLTSDSTRQELRFRLPFGARTSCRLAIPGDVELKSGAAVLSRTVEDASTRFDLLLRPDAGETRLVLTLNSHRAGGYRTVLARSVQFAEITEQYERLHSTVSLAELHQGIRECSFRIPRGFETTEVRSTLLDRWQVRKAKDDTEDDVLEIRFREQVPGLTTLHLSALKTRSPEAPDSDGPAGGRQDRRFPRFRPMDVAAHSSVLGLLLEDELELLDLKTDRLLPIDTMPLAGAIPPSALETFPGSPPLRLALAWYAPGDDWSWTATCRRPDRAYDLETEQILYLAENDPALQFDAELSPRTGKIFEADFEVPAGWKILSAADEHGRPVEFETRSSGRTVFRRPDGVDSGGTFRFSFRAAGTVGDRFERGTEKTLHYPVFRAGGTLEERGKIFIRNDGEEDWEIVPFDMKNLLPLGDATDDRNAEPAKNALAFQYSSAPFSLALRLKKSRPRIKAEVFSFYRIEPALIRVRYEIGYAVEQASTRRLSFLLPAECPATPSVQGLDGLVVEETFSEEIESEGKKLRRWEVRLNRPRSGRLRVGIDFEQPLSDSHKTGVPFELPRILIEHAAWQTDYVAVEGSEELDITIPTDSPGGRPAPRPVDTGTLASATYKPGERLLGVFSVFDDRSPFRIEIRNNTVHELVSGMIRSVAVRARLDDATNGVLYSVEYDLKTAAAAVKTRLGADCALWTVLSDDRPVKPQRVGEDILIPISRRPGEESCRLVLIYRESTGKKIEKLSFPALRLAGKAEAEPIPVMQTRWTVVPPSGFDVVKLGDPATTSRPLQKPAIFRLLKGSVEFFSLLTYRPDISQIGCSHRTGFVGGVSSGALLDAPASIVLSDKSLREGFGDSGQTTEVEAFHYIDKHDAGTKFPLYENRFGDRIEERAESKAATYGAAAEQSVEQSAVSSVQIDPATWPLLSERRKERYSFVRGRGLQSARPVSVNIRDDEFATGRPAEYSVIGDRAAREIPVRLLPSTTGSRSGWTVFLIVVAIGLGGLGWPKRRKSAFVFGILVVGTVAVCLPGLECFAAVFNGAVYGAAAVALIYLGVTAVGSMPALCRTKTNPGGFSAGCLFCGLASVAGILHAAETSGGDDGPKIVLPPDAIVVPYTPEEIASDRWPDADERTRPRRPLLVPYRQYADLLRRIDAENAPPKGLRWKFAEFAISAARYQASLETGDGNDLTVAGRLRIDLFTDKAVLVPLTLKNGVFRNPLLDGKPAAIKTDPRTGAAVFVEGIGEHELTFEVRVGVRRQGGWRIVEGSLPTASASKVLLTLPENGDCDLLTANPLDRKKWDSRVGRILETSLDPQGAFRWQWRSSITEDGVDRNLEIESAVRLDIQEDGCWVRWSPTFRVSRGKWEMFRLKLPRDFTIVDIVGENIRGWNVVPESDDSDRMTVAIELLKPAETSETISVYLMRRPDESPSDDETHWTVPNFSIPEAAIHRGRIDIYRSVNRNLRIPESAGLSPADPGSDPKTAASTGPQPADRSVSDMQQSPFGTEAFRSYRFVSESFAMTIASKPVRAERLVSVFSVLKLTRRETLLETKIRFPSQNRPFHAVVRLPQGFRLKKVDVPDGIFWSPGEHDANRDANDVLNIYCGDGFASFVEILLDGSFPTDRDSAAEAKRPDVETLPDFSVRFPGESDDDTRLQNTIAVLTEPSLDVRAEHLTGCLSLPADRVFSRLILPEQRELVRLALQAGQNVRGRLVLTERKPEVRCSTITNIRATSSVLEATTLLDFEIVRAGIRRIEFELPAWMKDARIEAPLLRRKTVVPTGRDAESPVLVLLDLQEDVLRQYRVLIQADRRLRPETDYRVAVPRVRTGSTTRQYIVLENDRRSPDELVVDPARTVRLRALSRGRAEWNYLASILGTNVTEAYWTVRNAESAAPENDGPAALSFRMKRRDAIRLVEARIDSAETRIVLDRNGAYRAEQIYRIDNKQEPYLDVVLPEGAALWGARFLKAAEWEARERGDVSRAGQPVKPCVMPKTVASGYAKAKGRNASRLVRIPLVKTESGDPDYVVRLVYAGELDAVRNFVRLDLPFVEVLNIPVGESLVRLHLPPDFDYRFSGLLQQVRKEREDEVVRLAKTNYLSKQDDRLRRAARSDNPFAVKRAKMNLGLKLAPFSGAGYDDRGKDGSGTLDLSASQRRPDSPDAGVPIFGDEGAAEPAIGFNDRELYANFRSQTNWLSQNAVQNKSLKIDRRSASGRAIGGGIVEHDAAPDVSGRFNESWFANNQLADDHDAVDAVRRNQQPLIYQSENLRLADTTNVPPSRQATLPSPAVPVPADAPRFRDQRLSQAAGAPAQFYGVPIRRPEPEPATSPLTPLQQAVPVPESRRSQRNVAVVQGQIVLGGKIIDPRSSSMSAPPPESSTKPGWGSEPGSTSSVTEYSSGGGAVYLRGSGRLLKHGEGSEVVSGGFRGMKSEKAGQSVETGVIAMPQSDPCAVAPEAEPVPVKGLSTQTASLDIEIPYRGKTFLFTTPQGELDLSLRPISGRIAAQAIQLFAAGLALALVYGVYRICLSIGKRFVLNRRTHRNLAGLVTLLGCLTLPIAPLAFVLLMTAAALLWASFFGRKTPPVPPNRDAEVARAGR